MKTKVEDYLEISKQHKITKDKISRFKKRTEKMFKIHDDLCKDSRMNRYVLARQVFTQYLRNVMGMTYKEISEHTLRTRGSSINSIRNFYRDCKDNEEFLFKWRVLVGEISDSSDFTEYDTSTIKYQMLKEKFNKIKEFMPLIDEIIDSGLEEEIFNKINIIAKVTLKLNK